MWKNSTAKAALTAAMLMSGVMQAYGQEVAMVTLMSLDGNVVMTGELQGFEDGNYSIVVLGLGLVSVAEELVTCQSTSIDCAALVSNS